MPKLVACINVWNEESTLKTCLLYAHLAFDKIVIAEGAYIGRARKPHSTDNTLNIIRKYMRQGTSSLKRGLVNHEPAKPVKLLVRDSFWETEAHKRNEMLHHVDEGDWYFGVDGDFKQIWGNLDENHVQVVERIKNLPDDVDSVYVDILKPYNVLGVDEKGRKQFPIMRYPDFMAFRKRRGVHFCYNHYTLCDMYGQYVWNLPDWKCVDVGVKYEELQRPHHNKLVDGKRIMFRKGQYVELSNGVGGNVCLDCKHGDDIYEGEKLKGFKIPRGMRLRCPKCGSGALANPSYVQARISKKNW